MRYLIRPMMIEDLPLVIQIEETCFPQPWSEDLYRQELVTNSVARYLALFEGEELLGYVGIWLIVGEVHITTIAVREDRRRQGIGEALLIAVIDLAADHGADLITLEVRQANVAARQMYRKFGFTEVGMRPRYYSETGEDAVLMNAEDINSEAFQQHLLELKEANMARRK